MVRGAAVALSLALTWLCCARASVLVPTYVLPPDSFLREQRSLGNIPDTTAAESQRTIKRLIGGHMKIKQEKEYGDAKNSLIFSDKTEKGKFASFISPDASGGSTVGWNQGIWDDGMLMSSAGEGKEASKVKEVEEDKKTLADQVAEGKYGLIQNEIFAKQPKRPGILSYEPNSETRLKDNLQTLGGLKKDEIWLAEDHLLVLKGGSFPEKTKESEHRPWPPIDDYEAPRRQVKLPDKPKVPPPFPVRLTDNGPLVFLTPNGSIPASLFPIIPAGESESTIPYPPFPYAPGAPNASSEDSRNSSSGGASIPIPPFPFLPGNESEGFPFPTSMNGSFPDGFPPGAAFLPPPSNQTDLYDEDDPSIYYPPPYNFSYHADSNSKVPAGPLVPGIILPPPPDFFAPLEEQMTTTTENIRTTTKPSTTSTYARPKTTMKRPSPTMSYRTTKFKTRPTTTEASRSTDLPTTISTPPTDYVTTSKLRKGQRVVQIPTRVPVGVKEEVTTKIERPTYKTRTKLTSKPLSVSVIYDYPEDVYDKTTEKSYLSYNIPEGTPNVLIDNTVTSTPVPLRAYYSKVEHEDIPTTKLQPVYSRKPNNPVTSFYFYDEQPKTSPSPATYFDGRNYYKTVPSNQTPIPPQQPLNANTRFNPNVDVAYGSIDQVDALYLWPQKQGPRTVTQEYFSVQKPQNQFYDKQHPRQRPNGFYQQIADIQQTIDLFATKRPHIQSQRPRTHKAKSITPRPVYQFNYQNKQRPDQFIFRAPKLDPEPFRPMVSYSKPFDVENEFNSITPVSPNYHQQYLVENVKVTTETPTSPKYYPKSNALDVEYGDAPVKKEVRINQNINYIPTHINNKQSVNHHVNRVPSTTPNPITNGYYTQQDETYFDDITKNSFDIFGKKIEDNANGIGVTEPLGTVRTPIDNDIDLRYAYEIVESQSPNPPNLDRDTLVNDRFPRPTVDPDSEPIPPQISNANANAELIEPRPPSLLHDTLVNEKLPHQPINPDSEFIPIENPIYRSHQFRPPNQVQRQKYSEQYDLNRPSLADDTAVNFRRPLPPINPDAEWIGPVNEAGEGRPGSFVSYRLPGEGAHVYFLTPQTAQAARDRYRSPGYGR